MTNPEPDGSGLTHGQKLFRVGLVTLVVTITLASTVPPIQTLLAALWAWLKEIL